MEYLFRGKDKETGKWHYGYLVPHMNDAINRRSIKVYDVKAERAWATEFEVIPETISQYSGLLDKNGVKLFDKDIVRYDGKIYLIAWHDKFACFAAIIPNDADGGAKMCNANKFEKIGNFFDNPELLESKMTKTKRCFVCGNKLTNKTQYTCSNCGKVLCGKHSFTYVDGNNGAITKNSPILCRECYEVKYE
ncbi:MAG: YopX family protein [Treponema sp.]|jgi:predicted RNA-binding Zn-ribbon protein involved in translation (DUF1610 family)|nr:YopX family protein [Treponema sp.]